MFYLEPIIYTGGDDENRPPNISQDIEPVDKGSKKQAEIIEKNYGINLADLRIDTIALVLSLIALFLSLRKN